jgi:hypothetical protein
MRSSGRTMNGSQQPSDQPPTLVRIGPKAEEKGQGSHGPQRSWTYGPTTKGRDGNRSGGIPLVTPSPAAHPPPDQDGDLLSKHHRGTRRMTQGTKSHKELPGRHHDTDSEEATTTSFRVTLNAGGSCSESQWAVPHSVLHTSQRWL